MSKKKNKKKRRKPITNKSVLKHKHSHLKMSEIMWEFAGDYIRLGEDLEHKQNLLNSPLVFSKVWNIYIQYQKIYF